MCHKFPFFFLQNCKKLAKKKKVFYMIAFDLIKLLKCWASQNDSQILIFEKTTNVVFKKMTRDSNRSPHPSVVRLTSDQSLAYCMTISGHFFAYYIKIFHKTEIQKVILRCLVCLNPYWIKSNDIISVS